MTEFKLVPVVPTEAMLKAGMMYLGTREDGLTPIYMEKEDVLDCYKAMLAASPANDGEVASWQYRYMLGNTGIWSEWEQTASESSAKGIIQKHALHKLSAEYRATYTAPPRVVDDGMTKVFEVLKNYRDGRVHSNPHTRQVARDIAEKIKAALETE